MKKFTLGFLTFGSAFFSSLCILFIYYGIEPLRNGIILGLNFAFVVLYSRRLG